MFRNQILIGDVREQLRKLPDGCVQCCVTSPPYWGLRDYGVDGQLGLERTPEEYTANMVDVFREVKRVLRDDGVLWLNLGDSYNAYNGNAGPGSGFSRGAACDTQRPQLESGYGLRTSGLKPKDMVGIPWRIAFALQSDGWYLRSDIIWHKPSCMPSSVKDRPTTAHEYVFLLSKSQRYFYDAEAVKEQATGGSPGNKTHKYTTAYNSGDEKHRTKAGLLNVTAVETRNLRSVWRIAAHPFKQAHFATFPPRLAETCIKAGSSEKGCCPTCGKPWVRVMEKVRVPTRPGTGSKVYVDPENSLYEKHNGTVVGNRDPQRHCTATRTVGWQQSCKCVPHEPVPCLILDHFSGAGTTCMMAAHLGRDWVGIEINPDYAAMAIERIKAGYQPPKSKRPPTRKHQLRERLLFAMEEPNA